MRSSMRSTYRMIAFAIVGNCAAFAGIQFFGSESRFGDQRDRPNEPVSKPEDSFGRGNGIRAVLADAKEKRSTPGANEEAIHSVPSGIGKEEKAALHGYGVESFVDDLISRQAKILPLPAGH